MLYLPGDFTPDNFLAAMHIYRLDQTLRAFREPGPVYFHFYPRD